MGLIHGIEGQDYNAPVPIRFSADGSFTPWDRPVATLKTGSNGGDNLTYTAPEASQSAISKGASNIRRGWVTGDGWVNIETSEAKNVTSSKSFDLTRFIVTGFFVSELSTQVDKIRLLFEEGGNPQNFSARSHTGMIPIIGVSQLTIFQPEEITLMGYLR